MNFSRFFLVIFFIISGILTLINFTACESSEEQSNVEVASTNKAPTRNLQEAAFLGDIRLLQAHIAAGSDLNQKDEYGSTPLIISTIFGKTAVAKQLIQAGAELNITGADGGTALHNAAFYCRIEIVEALLAKGADISVRNQFGATALESVEASFEDVKMVYDQISKDLGPLGFKLDYTYVEATRPKVAEMIRQAQLKNSSSHDK